jgi:hypothetical protein
MMLMIIMQKYAPLPPISTAMNDREMGAVNSIHAVLLRLHCKLGFECGV